MDAHSWGLFVGGAAVALTTGIPMARRLWREWMRDEGENGSTTSKRLLLRIDENVTQLNGKADGLAKTLADHGERIERLEKFTGIEPRNGRAVR